jgi:hypothetical protein
MSPAEPSKKPKSVGARRAAKMLDDLQSKPFVTFVLDDDEITVYHKGLDEDQKQVLEDVADTIQSA